MTRRSIVVATTCLLLAAFASQNALCQDTTQYHGGATNDNSGGRKMAIDNPAVAWHCADAFGQPTVAGDDVYAGGKGLFRIHADSGEVLGRVDVPMKGDKPEFYYVAAPIITDKSVIARRGAGIEARSRDLETVIWAHEIPGASKRDYSFPATLFEGTLLFASGSDLFAMGAEKGDVLWQISMGAPINMVPVAADGHVFVGAASGRFVAIDIEAGTETWAFEGEGQFGHTSPILVDGTIVVGDRGVRGGRRGALIALDAKTGEKKWETVFGATGLSTPGFHKGTVFAGYGKSVGFFSLKDGEFLSKPRIRCGANAFGSPTIIGKHLIYGHLDGNLYVHDAKSGKLSWQFRIPDAQISDFVYSEGRLFVATTEGVVALKDGKGSMKGNVKTWSPEEAK